MSAQEVTLRGRAEAENMMIDTCIVHREGPEVTDPETGVVTPSLTQVYAGPCKVQSSQPQASEEDAGGTRYVLENLSIHLPVSSQLLIDDIITITAATMDPDLVGLKFRAREVPRGTYRTADRWAVKLEVK